MEAVGNLPYSVLEEFMGMGLNQIEYQIAVEFPAGLEEEWSSKVEAKITPTIKKFYYDDLRPAILHVFRSLLKREYYPSFGIDLPPNLKTVPLLNGDVIWQVETG